MTTRRTEPTKPPAPVPDAADTQQLLRSMADHDKRAVPAPTSARDLLRRLKAGSAKGTP